MGHHFSACATRSMVIWHFLAGCFIGAAVVGSSVRRTVSVAEGNVMSALNSSILNSASYGLSIYALAHDDWIGYAGTAFGSTLIVMWMARETWRSKLPYRSKQ